MQYTVCRLVNAPRPVYIPNDRSFSAGRRSSRKSYGKSEPYAAESTSVDQNYLFSLCFLVVPARECRTRARAGTGIWKNFVRNIEAPYHFSALTPTRPALSEGTSVSVSPSLSAPLPSSTSAIPIHAMGAEVLVTRAAPTIPILVSTRPTLASPSAIGYCPDAIVAPSGNSPAPPAPPRLTPSTSLPPPPPPPPDPGRPPLLSLF